ncbi:MAG: response regulator transcription factor [Burkholderiaceae bacterium]|nr:response regulator transcription factor [Burkholderiaceae bacterium]
MMEFQKRILCIEDDRDTAALLAEDLSERGYAVRLAHDGRQGLLALLDQRPDLVICDVDMPVLSGTEMLGHLRAIAPWSRGLPFIFLTAMVDRDLEHRCRSLGADDYVIKPIDFEELHARVHACLVRAERRGPWPDHFLAPVAGDVDAIAWAHGARAAAAPDRLILSPGGG